MTKEVLKLALEALEKNNNDWKRLADSGDTGRWTAEETELYKQTEQAIIAIKEALAQTQEPVAWGFQNTAITGSNRWTMLREEVPADDQYNGALWTPLYTTPPALAQPEKPKYRRGNRLICLETEEYCIIHISGTDRQWVKFPDSHIGVYTNEQVAELFELLPKEPEQEPVGEIVDAIEGAFKCSFTKMLPVGAKLYTTTPQRKPLTDEEIEDLYFDKFSMGELKAFARAIEAKLKEKTHDTRSIEAGT